MPGHLHCGCAGQRTIFLSWFSPSMWIPGIQLESSVLVEDCFHLLSPSVINLKVICPYRLSATSVSASESCPTNFFPGPGKVTSSSTWQIVHHLSFLLMAWQCSGVFAEKTLDTQINLYSSLTYRDKTKTSPYNFNSVSGGGFQSYSL